MKKFISIILLLALTFSFLTTYAADEISLYVNENKISCDVSPKIVNDRVLCPVRAIFDAFGAEVKWNGTDKTVFVKKDSTEILLTVGSTTAQKNGSKATLDCAPVIISDRCMVPIRFISEALGCDVKWESATKSVKITYKEEKPMDYKITDIKLAKSSDSYCSFEIAYNGKNQPKLSYLSYSNCIVADFDNTSLAFADSKVTIDNAIVKEIRYAAHDTYSRVVIECKSAEAYTSLLSNGIFTINVGKENTQSTPTQAQPNQSTSSTLSDREFTASRNENNLCVVIDAGHGGKDPGAVYTNENGEVELAEKDVNLTIANKVYNILKNEGINVKATRTTDKFLELKEITDIANGYDADLFVSVHINAMENSPEVGGMMVLYNGDATGTKYGINSKEVAQNIDKKIAAAVNIKDRGIVSRPGLWVLKKTNMPAVLIECAFISNEGDRKILTDEVSLNAYARSIADGIKVSLETMKKNIIKAKK